VTWSTALALQRFIDSCTSGILQANNRADDAANETIARGVFAQESNVGGGDEESLITCGRCLPDRAQRICCGRGECVNDTCHCNPG